jgi:curved DNA-binding protein CbpA
MSAPVSGKFQDHYLVMGVEPKADSETIQAAYNKLAQKYHPKNPETGNAERFESLNLAYEVLSDASLRSAFDTLKGVDQAAGNPKFTGLDFFQALQHGSALRSAVLCVLYDRRRLNSYKPTLSLRHLEGMLQVTGEDLHFAVWYLKQRNYVINDDKSSLQITVEGMDYIEQHRPSADDVMPLIREDALATPKAEPAKAPAAEAKVAEPILNVLNRNLQRSYGAEETRPPIGVRREDTKPTR